MWYFDILIHFSNAEDDDINRLELIQTSDFQNFLPSTKQNKLENKVT
jgi:hypothetical protein